MSDVWVPVGKKVGMYSGSIIGSIVALFLVDRYYSPWKRFVSSLLSGDFYLKKIKNGDFQKIIESSILGPCVGYLIYWDLREKKI